MKIEDLIAILETKDQAAEVQFLIAKKGTGEAVAVDLVGQDIAAIEKIIALFKPGAPAASLPKTSQQVVDDCNSLARELYALRGYEVPEGYWFPGATHPHEVAAWRQAVAAYEFIECTDVENALDELQDDRS